MLGADERIVEREIELFEALRAPRRGARRRASRTPRAALATLDVLAALAETAAVLQLHQAARCMPATSCWPPTRAIPSSSGTSPDAFVPNDIALDATASVS